MHFLTGMRRVCAQCGTEAVNHEAKHALKTLDDGIRVDATRTSRSSLAKFLTMISMFQI